MHAVEQKVRTWLEDVIVGLNLCPFARGVHDHGLIRFSCSNASDPGDAVQDTLEEARLLLEGTDPNVATTLVIFPNVLSDFDELLSALGAIEGTLSDAGADGIMQVVSFHPHYQFEGAGPDDLQNYTNRCPYPMFHLLMESDVTRAVESHPDPEAIPEHNIDTLNRIGKDDLIRLWSRFS